MVLFTIRGSLFSEFNYDTQTHWIKDHKEVDVSVLLFAQNLLVLFNYTGIVDWLVVAKLN